jgi:putative spermidine/putrescine transport system permease protein
MRSLSLSFQVAVLSTVFSTVLGILTSVAMVRGRFPGKTLIYAFLLSPMIIPVIITAVAIFFFFAKLRMVGSPLAMAFGHTVTSLPIVLITVSATLQGVDKHLEQAAIIMGASPLKAFLRITLPIIAPGVLSGAIFAFLHSFDELLISLFLASAANQTLPVRIWNSVLLQVEPTIAAVSSVLIGFTIVILMVTNVLQRK